MKTCNISSRIMSFPANPFSRVSLLSSKCCTRREGLLKCAIMIDLELFKKLLTTKRESGWIEPSDLISFEVSEFLISFPPSKYKGLFKGRVLGTTPDKAPKFKVQAICYACSHGFVLNLTKTQLFEFLRDLCKFKCNTCLDVGHKLAEEQQKAKRLKTDPTQHFKDEFLNPAKFWNATWPVWKQIECLGYYWNQASVKDLSDYIKGMDYGEFLKTPYWKAIASEVRKRAKFKCALCSHGGQLHVHHNSYDHHGEELQYAKTDLICLCSDCHETFHNKREVSK